MFDALARLANRRAKRVVLVAAVFFLVAGALGGSVADRLDPYGADDPATETVKATKLLEENGYRSIGVVVLFEDADVRTAATKARVEQVSRELRRSPDVASLKSYYTRHSPAFVSRDRNSTYIAVALKPTEDKAWQGAAERVQDDLSGRPGIVIGGPATAQQQVNDQVESDLQRAEMLAFPLLFLLSLLFFRSLVAALLPLMIGAFAIVGTFLILRAASELTSISIFALNLTTALGLGLAIDYSLFVVARYREELARTGPGFEAIRTTMRTAGRTVLFSSLTVAAALASLTIFPQRFLYSMGLGGSLVALLAAAVALTVLPAVLVLLGDRVNALAPSFLARRAESEARPTQHGFWYRLSRFVMRRPLPIAVASAAVLIVAGIPFFNIKFNAVDPSILPEDASARVVYDRMQAEFPPNYEVPIQVAVEGGDRGSERQLRAEIRQVPGVSTVLPPQPVGDRVTLIEAVSDTPYPSESSQTAAERIRALPEPAGARVLVTGATADFLDFQDSLAAHLPIAVAIIVVTTLVIIFLMTGSVVLPIKSLLMNVLNLSAVFGLLVLIFQDGRFESVLDYSSPGAIEQTMPILLFAVAFGLSTDYAMFLLSRIKEARDNGASDSESVAIGLERTGRIVTAAALLFSIALGAFATSEIIFIKENGVGTALAVLIDASIIRALLVPSLMELLGSWNWWAPGPLRRLHARIGIDEAGGHDLRRGPAPEGT
jgi:RND superfamily putative drug exporter